LDLKFESLRISERIALMLRSIYELYGYRNFRMGKFEEYDFYTENRDFLPAGPIITFTDMNGKLMALKPDVTMSIVRNTRASAESPERLYYTESIYRMSREVREFKEIYQIGVEYIGSMAPFISIELVNLACKSLACIEDNFVLDISHMGYLMGLFDSIPAVPEKKRALMSCIERKNAHELRRLAQECSLSPAVEERLLRLLRISGPLKDMLMEARALCVNDTMCAAVGELSQLSEVFPNAPLRLDFSATSDPKYYNGLMFRGFVQSVPCAVLSGGRYDQLLERMGKGNLAAIGFAIYLDEVERCFKLPNVWGYDAFILYGKDTDMGILYQATERLTAEGKRVGTGMTKPESLPIGVLYRLTGGTLVEGTP